MGEALAYLEIEHHAVVLVFEIVAVKDELSGPLEFGDDAHAFARHNQYGVLPALLMGHDFVPSARAADYLKERAVHVHRVRLVAVGIVELPDFNVVQRHRLIL